MQPSSVQAVRRPPPLFMLPPPLIFGVAFAAGVVIEQFVPVPGQSFGAAAVWAGAVLAVVGIGLAAALVVTFLIRRTTLNPFAEPSAFVARGPYRLSRNPMYVALVTAYLGGALMYGSIWPFVALLGPVAVLSAVVIPFEEARMAAAFGESYRAYRDRVRRWI